MQRSCLPLFSIIEKHIDLYGLAKLIILEYFLYK